jgi:TRAP-type C4-dicarboxylate transport system substrate-binding protein
MVRKLRTNSDWRGVSGFKQKLVALLLVIMLLALSGCSGSETDTASETPEKRVESIELRLAHFWPATHPAEKELVQPWAKAVEEATDGRVKIVSYPNETLLPANEIYAGVVDGIADIGSSCFAYNRGRFPVLEVFELPGITYRTSTAASKVAWEGIKELNPQEVQDTKLMMVLTTGPGDLYTKVPVRNLDDLKGMEIRATGLSAKTLEALGATPVPMPQSEAYESLSKGVVKGNLGPDEVLKGWSQADVTDYLTETPFLYNTLFFITMNLDTWNSLDADIQEAIEEVNEKYFSELAAGLWDKQNEAARKWAVEEKNMELIPLSQEETDKWIELVEPIQQDFVKQMNEKGFEGQKILDTAKELAEKHDKENS